MNERQADNSASAAETAEPARDKLVELAKLGDPTTIAKFLNEALAAEELEIRARFIDDRMELEFRSARRINRFDPIVQLVEAGFASLGLKHVDYVRFSAYDTTVDEPSSDASSPEDPSPVYREEDFAVDENGCFHRMRPSYGVGGWLARLKEWKLFGPRVA